MSCLSNPNSQQGVSLLEVLVSLVLVSLVAVTAAVSNIRAQQGQQQAYETSLAAALGQDLIERIRANPSQLNDYEFNWNSPSDCPTASTSLASQDLASWCTRLYVSLPSPQAEFDSTEKALALSWQARIVAEGGASGGYFASRDDSKKGQIELQWFNISTKVRH